MIPALARILTTLVGLSTIVGKEVWVWAKQEARRIARAARALAVWVATHTALRIALSVAVLAAAEAFLYYLTSNVITPLAGSLFAALLPQGQHGDFFYYIFWDSGLNASQIVSTVVLYLGNYSLLWAAFDRWLRGMAIALSVYSAGLRRQKAVLDTSLT